MSRTEALPARWMPPDRFRTLPLAALSDPGSPVLAASRPPRRRPAARPDDGSRGTPRAARLRREVRVAGYASWRWYLLRWPSRHGPPPAPSAGRGSRPFDPLRLAAREHRDRDGRREEPRNWTPARKAIPFRRSCSRSSPSGPSATPTVRPRWSSRATCCPTTTMRSRPMREVDEALRRAFAQRANRPAGGSPAHASLVLTPRNRMPPARMASGHRRGRSAGASMRWGGSSPGMRPANREPDARVGRTLAG